MPSGWSNSSLLTANSSLKGTPMLRGIYKNEKETWGEGSASFGIYFYGGREKEGRRKGGGKGRGLRVVVEDWEMNDR